MFEKNLVSAVLITYKRPIDILARAIVSVLNQTYENIELIIVNDNPDEKAMVMEIEDKIKSISDGRIRYLVHEKNMGACKARNTGIEVSKGDFIALLDDDDEWLPQKTEKQLEGFTSENVGMVYSPFYNVTDTLPGNLTVRSTKSGYMLEDMLWTNCIGGSSMPMIRREAFDKCGLFDESLLSSQDYDMWLRISQVYEINYIDKPLTRRYVQKESITSNFEKQKQGFYAFSEKYKELYKEHADAYNYRLNRRVNKWLEQGHFTEAWKLYRMAIRTRLFSKYNIIEPIKGVYKLAMRC